MEKKSTMPPRKAAAKPLPTLHLPPAFVMEALGPFKRPRRTSTKVLKERDGSLSADEGQSPVSALERQGSMFVEGEVGEGVTAVPQRKLPAFIREVGKTYWPLPGTPTSPEESSIDDAIERLARIKDSFILLKDSVHERSAAFKREVSMGVYPDDKTPTTSQESQADNSVYSFDGRPEGEIVSSEDAVNFLFENEEISFLYKVLLPYLGAKSVSPDEATFDLADFKTAAWKVLKNEPRVLMEVLERAIENAENKTGPAKKGQAKLTREEEEEMIRADLPGLP